MQSLKKIHAWAQMKVPRLNICKTVKDVQVLLRMQCGNLRTNSDCHKSMANPAFNPLMYDLDICKAL